MNVFNQFDRGLAVSDSMAEFSSAPSIYVC